MEQPNAEKTQEHVALVWLKRVLDVDRYSEYIDQNILTFRYLPHAVAIVGAAVLFRSIRLATKFTDKSQIPRSFLRKNVQLRGMLKDVDLDGTLVVEHLPIIKLPWHRLYKNPYLPIRLAFTSPNISGIYWLRLNATGHLVKFRLLDCTSKESNSILWASVKVPQMSSNDNKHLCPTLNETLIRKGIAKVELPFNRALLNKREAKILQQLEIAEGKAHKEGLGVWSEDGFSQVKTSWWQSIKERFNM